MARIIWSRRALRELKSSIDYIAARDAAAARRMGLRLIALGNSLSHTPDRGRPAGQFRELVTVRPYILRYSVSGDTVTILSIRHSRRLPSA